MERVTRPSHRCTVVGDAGHHARFPDSRRDRFDIADPILQRQRVTRGPKHPRQEFRHAGGLMGADKDQHHVRRLDVSRIASGARMHHEIAGHPCKAQPLCGHRVHVIAPRVEQRDVVIPPRKKRAKC